MNDWKTALVVLAGVAVWLGLLVQLRWRLPALARIKFRGSNVVYMLLIMSAALIDGANIVRALTRMVLPLILPAIIFWSRSTGHRCSGDLCFL
jgi:ABC-type sugar transport system permease subunit